MAARKVIQEMCTFASYQQERRFINKTGNVFPQSNGNRREMLSFAGEKTM